MKSFWELNFKDMVSPSLAKVQAAANATFDRLDQGEKHLGETVHKTSEHIEHQESVFMEMGKLAMEFFAVEKIVEWGSEIFKAGMGMDSLKIQMQTLSGSTEEGNESFEKLSAMYQKFPILGKENIMKAGEQLMEMNVPIDQITTRMKQMGDLSGGDGAKMSGMVDAYKRAVGFGSVQARQLMAQPALLHEIERMYGMNGVQIKKFLSEGEVGIKDLNKAYDHLTGAGGRFHNMLENSMEGTAGKVARLKMRFEEFGERVFNKAAPFINQFLDLSEKYLPQVEKALHDVWNMGKSMFAFFEEHKLLFYTIAGGAGAFAIAMAAMAAPAWLATAGIWALDMAMVGLDAILAVSPIGWIALALGAAAGAMLYFWNTSEKFRVFLYSLWESVKVVFGGIGLAIWDALKGSAKLLAGIFTFDKSMIMSGLHDLQNGLGTAIEIPVSAEKAWAKGEAEGHKSWADDHKPGAAKAEETDKGYNKKLPFAGNSPDADATGGSGSGKGSGVRNVILNAKEFVALHFHGITDIEHIKTVVQEHVPRVIVAAVNDAEMMLSGANG